MSSLESAAFREDLRRVVGRDFVYVNARDMVPTNRFPNALPSGLVANDNWNH